MKGDSDPEEESYQQKFNRIKALQFQQAREAKILEKVFKQWRKIPKYIHPHYRFVLCCKALEGFMQERFKLEEFESNLNKVYMKILLKTHFQAFKISKQERDQLIENKNQQLIAVLWKNKRLQLLSKLCPVSKTKQIKDKNQKLVQKLRRNRNKFSIKKLRELLQSGRKQQALKQNKKRQEEHQINTSSQIKIRNRPEYKTENNFYKLDESRQTQKSHFSITSIGLNKKYKAVKNLPKPILNIPVQGKHLQQYQAPSLKNDKIENIFTHLPQAKQTKRLIERQQIQISKVQQVEAKIENNSGKDESGHQQNSKKQKQLILTKLGEFKIFQIKTLKDIISEVSMGIKSQQLINERGFLLKSYQTLEKISSILQ